MVTMFVKHKVNDFATWKRFYDEFASVRKAKGVTGASVHRDTGDSSVVVVTHQFQDLGAATTFAGSEELKSTMMKAGVSGPPEIWFCNDVEKTTV